MSDEERLKLERRSFLEQCGRFAVATPPVVSLMLASGTKAALAASGGTTLTTSTRTATTVPSTLALIMKGSEEERVELALKIDSMGVMKHS
jgi:hypothetical protein